MRLGHWSLADGTDLRRRHKVALAGRGGHGGGRALSCPLAPLVLRRLLILPACPSGWDGRDLSCTRKKTKCASRAWVRGYMGAKVLTTQTLLAQAKWIRPR